MAAKIITMVSLKELTKLADDLDGRGLSDEADRIDAIVRNLVEGEAWYCPLKTKSASDDRQGGEVQFSGILKIMPNDNIINQVKGFGGSLPEEAIMLDDSKFHITLIHQSILKPFKKEIKELIREGKFPEFKSEILLENSLNEKSDEVNGRRSWTINVSDQQALKDYVNTVMDILGADHNPEPERIFHVSIANLTGNPFDSVR